MNKNAYPWQVYCASTLLVATLWTTTAQAQPKPNATVAAALPYRSAFEGYKKFDDQPVAAWAQTNATVEKIGGWRVYAKEARQPDASEGNSKVPAQSIKPGAHDAHGGKP